MSQRIKILYTIPNFHTAGSGKVVYDLVKGLNKTKFEPHICCMHSKGAFFEEVEKLGVPIHIFPFQQDYRPLITLPLRIYKVHRFFKKYKFDIIHSWHWSSDFTEPLAAKWSGIPFVYTKKAMGWGNKAWRWRSLLSTKIITINKDMEAFFIGMKDKLIPMPLGVDTERFQPLQKTFEIPGDVSFNQGDFVIVTVANLVPVKGIELLLEAVKNIGVSKIKVLIVGDNNSDYAKGLMDKYGEIAFFLGKKNDVKPYLAVADLFVIPTKDEGRKEGLPIAPMEAMASARLVLGSGISGITDLLEPFPEFVFKPSDVRDLQYKIESVYQMDIADRKNKAEEMADFVQQNLSLKQCVEQHQNLYQSLKN
ncbi:glycosyltransferase [Mangrovimonas aestuarii]|uniref:glycosyltransferase n=1 Tax=Mangrovimonas aestuarii TaxID=3018443 RepID=UPI0023798925|nr:glycosyltransferase [Mangrovimonas aestuarii]